MPLPQDYYRAAAACLALLLALLLLDPASLQPAALPGGAGGPGGPGVPQVQQAGMVTAGRTVGAMFLAQVNAQPAADADAEPADEELEAAGEYEGRRRDGMRPGGRGDKGQLTPEQALEAIEIIAQIRPELGQRIKQAVADHPERITEWLNKFPMIERLYRLKQRDADLYALMVEDARLDHQSRLLSKQLRAQEETTPEQRELLQSQLKQVVARHFELRQRLRARELEVLEKRIGELREQLETRKNAREKLVQSRVEQLIKADASASW